MKRDKNIESLIADTLIEKWQGFTLGGRHFFLYPITLGKSILLQRLVSDLGFDNENLTLNSELELLRVVEAKKYECCRYIVYHTMRTKEELFDTALIDEATEFFVQNADNKDIATLLEILLSSDKTSEIIGYLGLDKEQERYSRALKAKKSKDSENVSFCGTSIYGKLVDFVCERYGWTINHVVWEVSFANLQLIMADSVKQLYMTKQEMRKAHITSENTKINGDDKASMEIIKRMNWE